MKHISTFIAAAIVMLAAAGAAQAQLVQAVPATRPTQPAPMAKPPGPKIIKMTLTLRATSQPALQYHLLPAVEDQTPGNAVLLYYLGLQQISRDSKDNYADELQTWVSWLSMPLADLPQAEVQKAIDRYADALGQLELGSRRMTADWGLPLEEGINSKVPSLGELRHLARMLALKARLQMAQGKWKEAIKTLQVGFALGRHTGDRQPTLIACLVGMSIDALMIDQAEQLVQMPQAPNLYWALAALPQPMIDIRQAMAWERGGVYMSFPKLRDIETRQMSEQEWGQLYNELSRAAAMWRGAGPDARMDLPGFVGAIRSYPEAKQYLIARGRSSKEVEAMPVSQVVLLYMVGEYRHWQDEMFKWFDLPYGLAADGLRRTAREFAAWEASDGAGNLLAGILPTLDRAFFLNTQTDRRVAALQCIEAVRSYAAAHEGRLPDGLKDVTDTPIQDDPVTGKPFIYTLAKAGFVIECPSPNITETLRYEITLAASQASKGE